MMHKYLTLVSFALLIIISCNKPNTNDPNIGNTDSTATDSTDTVVTPKLIVTVFDDPMFLGYYGSHNTIEVKMNNNEVRNIQVTISENLPMRSKVELSKTSGKTPFTFDVVGTAKLIPDLSSYQLDPAFSDTIIITITSDVGDTITKKVKMIGGTSAGCIELFYEAYTKADNSFKYDMRLREKGLGYDLLIDNLYLGDGYTVTEPFLFHATNICYAGKIHSPLGLISGYNLNTNDYRTFSCEAEIDYYLDDMNNDSMFKFVYSVYKNSSNPPIYYDSVVGKIKFDW